jgi:hypothetical protein
VAEAVAEILVLLVEMLALVVVEQVTVVLREQQTQAVVEAVLVIVSLVQQVAQA